MTLQCPNMPRGKPHPTEGMGGNGWCRAGCGFNAYSFPTGYERRADTPERYLPTANEEKS
jgi:hypothetical protein